MSSDPLSGEPFRYRELKDGSVQISYLHRVVTTLAGRDAARFLAKVRAGDPRHAQLAMAKATGNFKRGNERASGDRGERARDE